MLSCIILQRLMDFKPKRDGHYTNSIDVRQDGMEFINNG